MRSGFSSLIRSTVTKAALVACLIGLAAPMAATQVDARAGGGVSFGSRGARSFSPAPSTTTAPRWSQPLPGAQSAGQSTGFGNQISGQGRRFGFGSGLAAGLLGAGLFGLLTGGGFFGGLSGLGSLLGLVLQLALIGGAIMLALRFFAARSANPAMAGRTGPLGSQGAGGWGGRGFGGGSAPVQTPITIAPADFSAFEQALGAIQAAHSREDLGSLARLATPAIVQQFGQDIARNRSRGVRNEVADVKLLQGDLAEAWREDATDYATVAMRFAARDVMVDRGTGRLIEGDPNRPVEATELWTFRRDRGTPWLLSAIQQAA